MYTCTLNKLANDVLNNWGPSVFEVFLICHIYTSEQKCMGWKRQSSYTKHNLGAFK